MHKQLTNLNIICENTVSQTQYSRPSKALESDTFSIWGTIFIPE